MSAANRCEHPVKIASNPATFENCGKPSVWMTDDARTVHFLCEDHARELMLAETQLEPVS